MLKAIEKIKKLMLEGDEVDGAILAEWNNIDKESLSFEELRWFQEELLVHSKKAEAWKLLKKKAKTLGQLKWVWKQTTFGTSEESEIFELIKEMSQNK